MRFIASALFYSAVFAIPTIEAKGAKFFTSDGDQFYVKGVAYQHSITDVNNLVNGDQCKIDAPLIKELGANVVRVYSVDPTLNHDTCMNAFADAGIYVLVDMSTPTFSINRADPSWTKELRNAFAQVVDGFQQYDNLLGFFAGNEIVNDVKSTGAAAYAKAVIADMKAYRDLMQYRKIPIGYSASDGESIRLLQQNYFDCGSDAIAADFYAFNRYSWCNDSSFTESGYDKMYDDADGYNIPIFLSETGCVTGSGNTPLRTFDDQVAILGRQMNDRYSGNIIYEWTQEASNYGLVSYKSSATGTPSLMGDYTRLKSQWATLSPAGVKASNYNPSLTRRNCPEFTSGTWSIQAKAAIPTVGTSGFTAPSSLRSTRSATRTGSGSQSTPVIASGGAKSTSTQN
ncbi:uncharacterized protein BDR25DRAFT_229953, partial [Lindgomyces ingoldianus]